MDLKGIRRAGFTAHGYLMRSDFGMGWNQALEAGGVAISDRIDVHLEIEAALQVAKAA